MKVVRFGWKIAVWVIWWCWIQFLFIFLLIFHLFFLFLFNVIIILSFIYYYIIIFTPLRLAAAIFVCLFLFGRRRETCACYPNIWYGKKLTQFYGFSDSASTRKISQKNFITFTRMYSKIVKNVTKPNHEVENLLWEQCKHL